MCLLVALQPSLELRQVVSVPNRVAVLVDGSRSMEVTPPEGGPSRAARAAALLTGDAPTVATWERNGHRVDVLFLGESLVPTTLEGLKAAPAADATRIGEALGELATRTAGHDLGAVVIISDGVDTGRIGKGPLDAETRRAIAALGAPVHTVWHRRARAARPLRRRRPRRRVRLRAYARDRSRPSSARAGCPTARSTSPSPATAAPSPPTPSPSTGPRRREDLLRLGPRPPRNVRFQGVDAGPGRRSSGQQQRTDLHSEGPARPRPRAARVRPDRRGTNVSSVPCSAATPTSTSSRSSY